MILSRRFDGLLLGAGIALGVARLATAASLYTETFIDSASGWQNRASGAMTVTYGATDGNPGGGLRGSFAATPFPPFDGAFVATGNLASANFIGNYDEVDAWLLGFDFKAGEIPPDKLQVVLYSGSYYIYRNLGSLVTQTGVWYSFRIPLLDPFANGWVFDEVEPPPVDIFTNVTRVEITVTREDVVAQSYYVDNIFLDRVPEAVELSPTHVLWLHLRNGVNYTLQGNSSLSGAWGAVSNFTATSSVFQAEVSGTNNWLFYRMRMD